MTLTLGMALVPLVQVLCIKSYLLYPDTHSKTIELILMLVSDEEEREVT